MIIIEATINTLLNRGWTPEQIDRWARFGIFGFSVAFMLLGGLVLPDWLNR